MREETLQMRLRSLLALTTTMTVLVATGATARPVDLEKADHSKNMKLIGREELGGATDVEFTKDGYAVVTVNGSDNFAGLWVVDVSDPTKPRPVGHLPCAGSGYDVGLWRDVAVMSSDSASGNSSTEKSCNKDGT